MAAALLPLAYAAAAPGAAARPHILLILADDLGYNDVGFHGSEIRTPFLDSLNAAGVELRNYYGHMICTPSRAALMSGRYAFHTGMQHSFWGTGQRGGLPLRFKTMADHLAGLGYATHMIGKWHLGFESYAYTPLGRGFSTYYGYLGGGEDYYSHKSGGYVDLHDNNMSVFDAGGDYSATLFANKTIDVIVAHPGTAPLFIYLAFQSVHSPIQAPKEWVTPYAWITNSKRRTMAGMASCMDAEVARVADAMKAEGLWQDTLFVFAADNGGPPYVANSNYPMRGGKWTIWEGGTHLTAFAHGFGLPAKVFTGLMHHCDWVATLVGAAGGTLNDTALPAPDGVDMWPTLRDPGAASGGPRAEVVMNVDPTNQNATNDAGGWSGYAAIRVGDEKLVLGWPGIPDSWCWPNQNSTGGGALAAECRGEGAGPGWDAEPERHDADAPGRLVARGPGAPCVTPPGAASAACCLRGDGNPDLRHFASPNASGCCPACSADTQCVGYTWNAAEAVCWLKLAVGACTPSDGCISAAVDGRTPAPAPPPAGYPGALTCGYKGTVPPTPELRTQPMLFDLASDPGEREDLAATRPERVSALRSALQKYIDSAVTPLNMYACGKQAGPGCRGTDPDATAARNKANSWVPWH